MGFYLRYCYLDIFDIAVQRNSHVVSQSVQISAEFKAGVRFKPEAYREYVEDVNQAANAEID